MNQGHTRLAIAKKPSGRLLETVWRTNSKRENPLSLHRDKSLYQSESRTFCWWNRGHLIVKPNLKSELIIAFWQWIYVFHFLSMRSCGWPFFLWCLWQGCNWWAGGWDNMGAGVVDKAQSRQHHGQTLRACQAWTILLLLCAVLVQSRLHRAESCTM